MKAQGFDTEKITKFTRVQVGHLTNYRTIRTGFAAFLFETQALHDHSPDVYPLYENIPQAWKAFWNAVKGIYTEWEPRDDITFHQNVREGGHLPDDMDFDELADMADKQCPECCTETERDKTGKEYCPECNRYIGLDPLRYDIAGRPIYHRQDFYRND